MAQALSRVGHGQGHRPGLRQEAGPRVRGGRVRPRRGEAGTAAGGGGDRPQAGGGDPGGVGRGERIRRGWAEEKVVRETMLSLHGHGVGTPRAVRFFKTYPPLVPPELTALPSPFDAQLVNGPFGDPALFVDLVHGRRAFLVHAGDLTALAPRKLLRVTDIFISHTHMDHWSGFDRFLHLALGRDRTVRLFGPPGMAERVDHKLRAYTWNLLEGYTNELAF